MDLAFKKLSAVRNVSLIFLGVLITQGSILILYVILARILSIEDFATFRQLFLLQAILSGIFFGALPTCLLYFSGCTDSEDEKKRYLQVVVALTIAAALLLSILMFFARDSISVAFNNEQMKEVLPYFSLSPLGILMIALMPSCHVAVDRVAMQPYLAGLIAAFIVIPCIVIASIGATLIEIVWLISVLYLTVGVGLSLLTLLIYGAVTNKASDIRSKIRQVLVYAWPLLAASAISIVGLKIDHLIIASLLGTFAYGLYSVGAFEIPIFNILQNSVTSVLMPKITTLIKENSFEDASNLWRTAAHRTASFTFPIALILMVNSDEIISLLFGDKYKDASIVFILFNSLAFARVITFGMALRALNKNHIELMITLIYLICGLLGSYCMAGAFGMNGAAVWVIVNTIFMSVLLSISTHRLTTGRLALWKVYPFKHLILALMLFVLTCLTEDRAIRAFGESWLVSVFHGILIILCWLIFLRHFYREKSA